MLSPQLDNDYQEDPFPAGLLLVQPKCCHYTVSATHRTITVSISRLDGHASQPRQSMSTA